MAARQDGDRTIFFAMRIDGDDRLKIGALGVAVGGARAPEGDILMKPELGTCGAGRLPVKLVDDLLYIGSDNRL